MTWLANAVDAALEWSIAGSFTSVGPAVRGALEHWRPLDSYSLAGRVIVVTGATSGLGLETATTLARLGATVELVARNAAKAEATCAQVRSQTGNALVSVVVADTGDLTAMRAAAQTLRERHPVIDVLIHNAGALDATRHESPQGLELTVASQVVGPFLLTGLLAPSLKAAKRARVLWVSSGGMYTEPLNVDALESPAATYDGTVAYARAKRAQVTLTQQLAQRFSSTGVVVHSMHPGWADTPGVARSLPTFRRVVGPLLRDAKAGADTLVWLAADDGVPLASTGAFWLDRRPRPIHRFASTRRSDTPEEREKLWRWVEARSGFQWPGG